MRKYLVLLLLIISLFSISSCKNNFTYDEMDKVTYENLLSLPGKYIVVAYQANCPNCEKLLTSVYDYYKFTEKNSSAMKIYAINVNLKINKDMLLKSDDEYPSGMIGTTNYEKIKVKTTPSIMVITNQKLSKVISDYNTERPVTEGKAYFEELMK